LAEEERSGDGLVGGDAARDNFRAEVIDGRTLRRQRTHDLIVEACRQLMIEGILRPDSRSLATRSDVSHRTLFWHFPKLQDVYREALEDAGVAAVVERRIPTDRAGILRAVVLGEVDHVGLGGDRDRQDD
jgi:AcrR family transcriptional regulator